MKEAEAVPAKRCGGCLRRSRSFTSKASRPKPCPAIGTGPVAQLLVEGRQHMLICGTSRTNSRGMPFCAAGELRNYVAQRARKRRPSFMAPTSPAVRQLCEEKGVGYLDLEGNARIAFGGVFIERMVADKPAAEQRELKSLFRPKSARFYAPCCAGPAAWRVTELSEISGLAWGTSAMCAPA